MSDVIPSPRRPAAGAADAGEGSAAEVAVLVSALVMHGL